MQIYIKNLNHTNFIPLFPSYAYKKIPPKTKSSDVQELNTATSSFNYDLVHIAYLTSIFLPLLIYIPRCEGFPLSLRPSMVYQ